MLETTINEIMKSDKVAQKIYLGTFARDELPKSLKFPCAFIINTQKRNQPGEHWLALYYNKHGFCDFFDSYGFSPTQYKLESYIQETSKGWSYNERRIQGYSHFCGYYCILFILYKSRYRVREFFDQFSSNYNFNDNIIFKLIASFS